MFPLEGFVYMYLHIFQWQLEKSKLSFGFLLQIRAHMTAGDYDIKERPASITVSQERNTFPPVRK